MNIKEIEEWYPESIKADGFDDCIIGITYDQRIVYDIHKMIKQMVEKDGMTEETAHEYFDFNIAGAYIGEDQPIYIWT